MKKRAFTLLEIMVSLTVLSVGIFGVFSLLPQGVRVIDRDRKDISTYLTFLSLYHQLCCYSDQRNSHRMTALMGQNSIDPSKDAGVFYEDSHGRRSSFFPLKRIVRISGNKVEFDLKDDWKEWHFERYI